MPDGAQNSEKGLGARLAPTYANGGVSHWMQQVDRDEPRAPLPGDLSVDVAIVGGGYTGLWTALYLAEAAPHLTIAVIDAHFCGFGASGRNGGWLSGEMPGQFRRYAASHGPDAAIALQREVMATIDEVVAVTKRHGIDADIRKSGLLHVATNRAQLSRLRAHVAAARHHGWAPDDLFELSPRDVTARVDVLGAMGGAFTPHGARVQPAKLVRGLATAVEALGVRVFENTPAVRIDAHRVETPVGTIRADFVVRAIEGYSHALPGLERALLPLNSGMIVTEPLDEATWAEIGWAGEELLADHAHSYVYCQRTADGRIAIGGRGVPYNYGTSYDRDGRMARRAVDELAAKLGAMIPATRGCLIERSWTGILGVPRDWCGAVRFDRASGLASAGGYVGHGVAGANLAARTLRDLILGQATPLTALPWVGRTSRGWEPEALRWLGARALWGGYRLADHLEADRPATHPLARVADTISGRSH